MAFRTALCIAWLTIASLCSNLGAAEQPNLVLITIDTLRADRVGAYGYPAAETPVLDALAAEGVLFENAIVQTPITLPSHASIMTGTYPMYHGLQDVIGRLQPEVPTLAEWFSERGYQTAAFVGSSVLMEQWGLNRGFQVYDDNFSTEVLTQIDFDRVERPAADVVELASKWLTGVGSDPFFLWIHLYDPHDPYSPPEPYASRFKDRPYDGEIAYTDAMLGRLMEQLRRQGLYDSSLIIATSDHGEMLGEHGEAFHAYFIYEAALRVPLIMRLPTSSASDQIGRGIRISKQVRSVDLYPTVIQLLGEAVPEWTQGESLLGLMAGKRREATLPAYAETHYPRVHFSWSPLFSYSDGVYKYIDAPLPEFYNLKEDPGELENLYEGNRALAHQFREQLYALQRKYAGTPGSTDVEADAETIEKLKALGYVAFSSGSASERKLNLPDPKLKIDTYNRLNRAIALSREGKKNQAITILREVAVREAEMPIVHFLLGTEYFSAGQYLLAVEQFQQTIERNPDSNVARYNLARSYSRAGLSDRAMETARELLEREPEHFGARHLLAVALSNERRFEEAIREESKALEIRPDFPEAHNNMGSFYLNLGRVEEAVQSYRKALEYAPKHLLARENLILAYLAQKNYDLALQEAAKTLQIHPGSSLAHFYSGQAYLGKGLRAEAESAFRKAKELNPALEIPRF